MHCCTPLTVMLLITVGKILGGHGDDLRHRVLLIDVAGDDHRVAVDGTIVSEVLGNNSRRIWVNSAASPITITLTV